jgi:16S rRNA (guanine966-N2)-methyltransferase
MRIDGGRFKGRVLATPAGRDTRPTSDRARQAIFNILGHGAFAVQGSRVLDAFAGSGALGLEALSRGASRALFLDNAPAALAAIRTNIDKLDIADWAESLRVDATRPPACPRPPADLVFLDPPYGQDLATPALTALSTQGWIAPDALCVVEIGAAETLAAPPGFILEDERRYGAAKVLFLRFAA